MNAPTLGIDMAKLTFVAALRFDQQRTLKAQFENHTRGFRKLLIWLKTHGVSKGVRVGVESTSTYGEALLDWLYAKGYAVFLLNPERVAHYARARGQRNQTDPADAAMIAAFTQQHEGTPWQPPSPDQKDLRGLTRARAQIVACSQALALQLQTASGCARAHLQALLQAVRRELAAIGRAIARHINAHESLREKVRRLMTFKSVGLITAAVVIAELPPITPDSDPRTIAAWAGLTPCRSQSGPREWTTRLSRKGNSFVRQALYMPALVGKRYNPLLRTFAHRLAEEGKSSGAILGALSHKMLRILVGMLRSNTDFDPNWSSQKN